MPLVSLGQVVVLIRLNLHLLQDDWLMSEVEIATGRNTLSGAISERFVENVGVRLYLGLRKRNFEQRN